MIRLLLLFEYYLFKHLAAQTQENVIILRNMIGKTIGRRYMLDSVVDIFFNMKPFNKNAY